MLKIRFGISPTPSCLQPGSGFFCLALLLVFGFVFSATPMQAQCNSELYTSKSMRNIARGFMYQKTYELDGRGGTKRRIEYPCILSKGTSYQFSVNSKDGEANGIILSLYNGRRERLASNYQNKRFFSGIEYHCKATGVYYVTFTFKNSQTQCGSAVMAFRR